MADRGAVLAGSRGARSLGALVSGLERRPVLVAFCVAFVIRAAVAIVITIGWGGSLFLDDASYSDMAEIAADGRLGTTDPYTEWLYDRTAILLVPITGFYEVFGPVKLFGQLYVALFGALTAALTARLALEVMDRRFALIAGLLVASLPSQILWSSLIMKDAPVWAILSALAVVAAVAARSTGRKLALLGLLAAVLIAALGFLRLQTLEVAAVALTLAMLFSDRAQRPVRVAVAAVMLVCIPLAFGMGVAGKTYVAGAREPGLQRALNAEDANTAVVAPTEGGAPSEEVAQTETGLAAQVRYLPTGISVLALRPWPWESAGGSVGVRMARAETIVWYPLIALALIGLAGAWRWRRALAFPFLAGGAVLVMYGLTEGNLGTAYRHRGEFVWALLLFSTLGIERLTRRYRRAP